MAARSVLVVVEGSHKAEIVKKAFFGPVTPQVPASILQFHPNATVIVDPAAGELCRDLAESIRRRFGVKRAKKPLCRGGSAQGLSQREGAASCGSLSLRANQRCALKISPLGCTEIAALKLTEPAWTSIVFHELGKPYRMAMPDGAKGPCRLLQSFRAAISVQFEPRICEEGANRRQPSRSRGRKMADGAV